MNEKDIQILVVVVVEKGYAGRDDFGIVELAGHAVDVREVEAGFQRGVDEPPGRASLDRTGDSGTPRRDIGIGSARQRRVGTHENRYTQSQPHARVVAIRTSDSPLTSLTHDVIIATLLPTWYRPPHFTIVRLSDIPSLLCDMAAIDG